MVVPTICAPSTTAVEAPRSVPGEPARARGGVRAAPTPATAQTTGMTKKPSPTAGHCGQRASLTTITVPIASGPAAAATSSARGRASERAEIQPSATVVPAKSGIHHSPPGRPPCDSVVPRSAPESRSPAPTAPNKTRLARAAVLKSCVPALHLLVVGAPILAMWHEDLDTVNGSIAAERHTRDRVERSADSGDGQAVARRPEPDRLLPDASLEHDRFEADDP